MRVKKYLVLFISFIFILKTVTYPIITVYAGENEFEDVPLEIFESGDVLPSSSATDRDTEEAPAINAAAGIVMDMESGGCFSKKRIQKDAYG